MRLHLTVATADSPEPRLREVEVDAPEGSSSGDLAASLAKHLGVEHREPTLSVSGEGLAHDAPVGRAPLVDGAAVALVEIRAPRAATPARRRTPVSLAVAHGPDAGHTVELASGRHTVGRSADADVCLDDSRLSRLHAEIRVTADGISIRDLDSTNGTRLGGDPVGPAPAPVLRGATVAVGDTTLVVRSAGGGVPAASTSLPEGTRAVNRRPRLQPAAPSTAIALPTPPNAPRRTRIPWIAMAVPIPFAAVLAVFFGPTMLAFALMSPLLMAGTALSERVGSRRTYAAERVRHARHLQEAMDRVTAACADEARRARRALPDPAEVLAIAGGPSARVWERRRGDVDTLAVSLGTCARPSAVRIIRPPGDAGPEHLPLADVPCAVPLGTVGVLGLCGGREAVEGVARSIVGQLATLHSPLDLDLVVIAADERTAAPWSWMSRLPHLRRPDGLPHDLRVTVLGRDPAGAAAAVRALAELVADRSAAGRNPGGPWAGSRTVAVLAGAAALRGLPELAQVLEHGPAVGVCVLALDDDRTHLPSEAGAVLDLGVPARPILDLPGFPHDSLAVDRVGPWWADRLSRGLAPLRDATPGTDAAALPATVGLAAVVGPWTSDAHALAARWTERPHTTRVPLGLSPAGRFDIDLATDGPHILVAGTTGSGKSELLRTLVASLALHNRPEHLTFVLIDYKGGAAFRECASLPHTAGVVTDLDDHLADRALTSLSAELKRRERLLAECEVPDFVAYQASSHGAQNPLARLVIVIDEFRALAEELPSFVEGMVRLAALGRSLGVHVVLATQRPAGVVTADIKANVNLRLCLRVRDRADAEDVIDAPDAARIDRGVPGRAFGRAGSEALVSLQCAHVSGPGEAVHEPGILVRDVEWGSSPTPWPATAPGSDGDSTELTIIVETVTAATRIVRAEAARAAWLEPLPTRLDPASLPLPANDFHVAIGLADLPATQCQEPLEVDLAAPGHWGFVGTPGSGRSTALVGTAHALAARRSSSRLHLYAVSGGSLAALADLPHCGAHVDWDDLPRLDRLVTRLAAEVASRRRLLAASGHATFVEWWTSPSGAGPVAPPPMVVLVDDWDVLQDRTEGFHHGGLSDRLLGLLREGDGVGLTGVLAGDRALLIGRAATALSHRVILRLRDRADAALAGLPLSAVPVSQPPGRGVLLDGTSVQLALPVPAPKRPAGMPPAPRPLRVESLPVEVHESDLAMAASSAPSTAATAEGAVLLGLGGDASAPLGLEPGLDGRRWLVSGSAGHGVSSVLVVVARSLLRQGRPLAVVSSRPGPLDIVRGGSNLLRCDPDRPEDLVALRRDLPALAVLVDQADELLDSPIERPLREIAKLVDRDAGLLVCGANSSALSAQYRGLAVDVARHRTGVLLGPADVGDADLFGLRLTVDRATPPGRGYLVRKGFATPIQLALPDTEEPSRGGAAA